MTGAPGIPPERAAGDFAQLAIQVARLDERSLAMQERLRELRSELRWLIGGLATLTTLGFTVLGFLLRHG